MLCRLVSEEFYTNPAYSAGFTNAGILIDADLEAGTLALNFFFFHFLR